jgi:DNA-binding protein YbaB
MFDKAKDLYKLQKQARQIKKELKNTHIEAEYEGVTVTINGEQEVMKIEIKEDATTNKSKLEDALLKAFNKAIKKSQQVGAEMMKGVMGDLNIPGMS